MIYAYHKYTYLNIYSFVYVVHLAIKTDKKQTTYTQAMTGTPYFVMLIDILPSSTLY